MPNQDQSPPQDFDPFELELKAALGRVEPPTGFADAVFRRVHPAEASATHSGARTARRPSVVERLHVSLPLAWYAAAILLLILFAVGGERLVERRREQAQARSAALQFALAMRITNAALLDAGSHLAAHRPTALHTFTN